MSTAVQAALRRGASNVGSAGTAAKRLLSTGRAVACEAAAPMSWNYPTAIRFGAGRISELPEACAELGMKRPLLITDPGIMAVGSMARCVRSAAGSRSPSGSTHALLCA